MQLADLVEFERNFWGHFDDNYELAEWCRLAVPDLIASMRELLVKEKKNDAE